MHIGIKRVPDTTYPQNRILEGEGRRSLWPHVLCRFYIIRVRTIYLHPKVRSNSTTSRAGSPFSHGSFPIPYLQHSSPPSRPVSWSPHQTRYTIYPIKPWVGEVSFAIVSLTLQHCSLRCLLLSCFVAMQRTFLWVRKTFSDCKGCVCSGYVWGKREFVNCYIQCKLEQHLVCRLNHHFVTGRSLILITRTCWNGRTYPKRDLERWSSIKLLHCSIFGHLTINRHSTIYYILMLFSLLQKRNILGSRQSKAPCGPLHISYMLFV